MNSARSNPDPETKQKVLADYEKKANKILGEMIYVLAHAQTKVDQAEYQQWLKRIKTSKKYG